MSSSEDDSAALQGFCFLDMAFLSPIFWLLLTPKCKNHKESDEDGDGKMGFASVLFYQVHWENM